MKNASTAGEEPVVEMADPSTSSSAAAVRETTLSVKDFDGSVTEEEIKELVVGRVGGLKSVKICVHEVTGKSLGYGYVTFTNFEDAAKALGILHISFLNGKRLRAYYSNSGGALGILFFKNLAEEFEEKAAKYLFTGFGNVTTFALVLDSFGKSKGYGYVVFDNGNNARTALQSLNGLEFHGKKLCVDSDLQKLKFTNVRVSNISHWMTQENLIETFCTFGPIHDAFVVRDEYGISKCVGFVKFEKWEDACNAVEMLNGIKIHGKQWTVRRALTGFDKLSDSTKTLCVKNLSRVMIRHDHELKKLFSPSGTVRSCKIIRNRIGKSKGFGFVELSSLDEALKAIYQLNSKTMYGKSLVVGHARCKSYKRRSPQAQVFQTRSLETVPTVVPRTPMQTSGDPGPGQHIFYAQHPPMIPFQAQVPHQMWPIQMVPTCMPMPMFFVPHPPMFHPQFQPGYQNQQPNMYVPMEQNVPQLAQGGPDFPIVEMATVATPAKVGDPTPQEQRRRMLGESLFALVEEMAPKERVAKVTGMILDLGNEEVERLLDSPTSLALLVAQALALLQKQDTLILGHHHHLF